jgi:lauroyl/myristoyl acyltransferase
MEWRRARAAVRMDGAWWRRFAELGCVWGPEWWKRGSPPVIAAIIFALAGSRRAAVLRNQRQLRGARPWITERWHAYRVFAEFARALTESMEQWSTRPRPFSLTVPPEGRLVEEALAERRGLLVLTGHFGSWEVAARYLGKLGRPVNLVMAHEPNPSVREFVHSLHSRHGINVIYSDPSLFAAIPILQALRRDEIVGMQIDPWGPLRGTQEIDFCGRPARFQLGPFVVARVAQAPLVPVFALRSGIRNYELRIAGRFDPRTPAESVSAFTATVRAYEQLVRERPAQWLLFEDVWAETPAAASPGGYEIVPQASGLRRR